MYKFIHSLFFLDITIGRGHIPLGQSSRAWKRYDNIFRDGSEFTTGRILELTAKSLRLTEKNCKSSFVLNASKYFSAYSYLDRGCTLCYSDVPAVNNGTRTEVDVDPKFTKSLTNVLFISDLI